MFHFSQGGGGEGGGGGGWDWIDHCFIAGWHIYTDIIQSIFILYYYVSTWAHMYLYDIDG